MTKGTICPPDGWKLKFGYLPSLKLTAKAPENWRLEDDCFLLGYHLYSRAVAVSFREARPSSLVKERNAKERKYFVHHMTVWDLPRLGKCSVRRFHISNWQQ